MVALAPCSDQLYLSSRSSHGMFEYVCGRGKAHAITHWASGAFSAFRSFLTGCEGGRFIPTKSPLGRNGRRGQGCLEAEQQRNFPKVGGREGGGP